MKKLFLFNILFICALSISAQLKVKDGGKVGVGAGSGTLLSKFSVGGLGDASAIAHISGSNTYGLMLTNSGSGEKYGLFSTANSIGKIDNFAVAVQGNIQISSGIGNGIGVRGIASNTSISAINVCGVSGLLNSTMGASIYGGYGTTETSFVGKYAGYFAGNVCVTGTVNGVVVGTSDSRLKTNVFNLDYQQTINKIMLLRPVEYNMQQVTFEVDSVNDRDEVVTYSVNRYDETSPVFQNRHYGLIAQEVQRIYPDLVYEGSDGYLGIDYTSLIPMLLTVVQQQQIEIENLKNSVNVPVSPNNAPARPQQEMQGITVESVAALFQNTPNPFNENTEIAFYLPQSVNNAILCVYDMNGRQLSQNVITQRGNSTFVVNGSSYSAGMYLYSLITDGQIVDTKRMILTK